MLVPDVIKASEFLNLSTLGMNEQSITTEILDTECKLQFYFVHRTKCACGFTYFMLLSVNVALR